MNPDTENALIVSSSRLIPTFELNGSAKEAKEAALSKAALIGRVTDGDSKTIAVRAQQALKKVISDFEKARKELKEPLLVAGRQLDNLVAAESLELEKEFGRISNVVTEFDNAERRRVLEEQRLQQEELARIEREKQAELKRIADEQAAREAEVRRIQEEVDRVALEAKLAAESMANAARNKKEAAIAEVHRIEAIKLQEQANAERQKQAAALRERARAAAAQTAQIEEQAGDKAYVASRPVEITTVAGQRTNRTWEITKINEWALARARPDLVTKITFDMRAVKSALDRGDKLPGVEARETFTAGVKLPTERKAIEV